MLRSAIMSFSFICILSSSSDIFISYHHQDYLLCSKSCTDSLFVSTGYVFIISFQNSPRCILKGNPSRINPFPSILYSSQSDRARISKTIRDRFFRADIPHERNCRKQPKSIVRMYNPTTYELI